MPIITRNLIAFKSLTNETLIHLHHTENLTIHDIAKKYGVSRSTVSRTLHQRKIKVRNSHVEELSPDHSSHRNEPAKTVETYPIVLNACLKVINGTTNTIVTKASIMSIIMNNPTWTRSDSNTSHLITEIMTKLGTDRRTRTRGKPHSGTFYINNRTEIEQNAKKILYEIEQLKLSRTNCPEYQNKNQTQEIRKK